MRVLLPLAASLAAALEPRLPTPARATQTKGTVLVADDEPLVREVARRVLEGIGLTVILASDGEEAVSLFKLRRGAIDLAVLDLTMPKMGGVEAFQSMRAIAPGVKALLTSGFAGEESDDASWRSGFLGFLRKPYAPQELVERVVEAMAKPAAT